MEMRLKMTQVNDFLFSFSELHSWGDISKWWRGYALVWGVPASVSECRGNGLVIHSGSPDRSNSRHLVGL